jgi:2,4-dienoyl-CoA reductase-like NADH-dependent reductase (Old Yellow Enzyme family)
MGTYDLVKKSVEIRNLHMSNRIVFPPFVTGYSNADGTISDRQIRFYTDIAKGGAGMIIVGATAVAPEGAGWMGNTRLDTDGHVPGLKKLFDAVKREGSAAGIQLYHAGISTNTRRTVGLPLVAPTALACPDGSGQAHELTQNEITILEEAFVKASVRAFSAGADFVEIHCAHGYLINQFLSPLTNKRTDEYGGSPENRARFALNIIGKTRQAVGNERVIGVRIGADEFAEGGYTIDYARTFSPWMVTAGADFIHVSATLTPQGMNEMYAGGFVKLSAAIKEVVDVPVICVGAVKNLQKAEEILAAGAADLVAVGRAMVADPALVNKSFKGNEQDVMECLDCWECFSTMSDDDGSGMKCPQNTDLP